jgi:hypothetical protein
MQLVRDAGTTCLVPVGDLVSDAGVVELMYAFDVGEITV